MKSNKGKGLLGLIVLIIAIAVFGYMGYSHMRCILYFISYAIHGFWKYR